MATEAQIAANQANAKLSTGPKSEAGRAASSKNHLSHGLTYRGGTFVLLPWEDAEEFNYLVVDLKSQYHPMNRTEMILVERMAQHHWLRNRATMLQGLCSIGQMLEQSEEDFLHDFFPILQTQSGGEQITKESVTPGIE